MVRRRGSGVVSYELLHAPQFGLFNVHEHPPWFTEGVDLDSVRWMNQAACIDVEPSLFYRSESPATASYLRPICAQCPVRLQCFEYAIEHNEFGWWGGTSESDRRAYKKAAPRGR